jgi:16S rRNA (cytosine967-C5)-methyltransferase
MDATSHAISVLRTFDIEKRPLDRMLAAYLKRHPEIGSRMRRDLSDIAFGVMRWRGRIDGYLVLSGKRKISNAERVSYYIENIFDDGRKKTFLSGEMPKGFPGGRPAFYSFPDFLYDALERRYGKGAAAVAMSLNSEAGVVLRANGRLVSTTDAVAQLRSCGVECHRTPVSPYGIEIADRIPLEQIAMYRKGLFEVQDEGSQLATMLAYVKGSKKVLDTCAGAGGKSLMLAMLYGDDAGIVSSDIDDARLAELKRRAARAHQDNIEVVSYRDLKADPAMKGAFDIVIVDAPCTGTGTIRRAPDLKWRLEESDIAERKADQISLLSDMQRYVRVGGSLVYVTCSVLMEEDEDVVKSFLGNRRFTVADPAGSFQELGVEAKGLLNDGHVFMTDPREGRWDGFFGVRLSRLK